MQWELPGGVGVQWELPGAVARRHQRHVFGFFPIPVRTRAFCSKGYFRFEKPALFLKAPRADVSERGGTRLSNA